MEKTYFKFINHPSDLFRNTNPVPLPDPKEDLEGFLISFLNNYQSDERVFLLNQYYKLLYHEFEAKAEELAFMKEQDVISNNQVTKHIEEFEAFLVAEAMRIFISWLLGRR